VTSNAIAFRLTPTPLPLGAAAVSLVILADIQDIVWTNDETGCYG